FRTMQRATAQIPPEARAALAEVVAELAASGVEIQSMEDLQAALAARPDLVARLAGLMADDGPSVPPQFADDLRAAEEGEARYRRSGDVAGLDAAVAAWQRILDHPTFAAADPRFRLAAWNDAGGIFLRRYWARERVDDLSTAIDLWQQAVETTQPGSPDLPMYLNNLGNGLSTRYTRTGNFDDLQAAISSYQQAVETTQPGSPDLPSILNNLGTGLSTRYTRTGNFDDLQAAIDLYDRASQQGLVAAPEATLVSARTGSSLALETKRWVECARLVDYGLQAIQTLIAVQIERSAQESWLREAQGLHLRGAYALAQQGRLTEAVEMLERGQARLLAQALEENRADLARLQQTAQADLYTRFRRTLDERSRLLAAMEGQGDAALLGDVRRRLRANHEERQAVISDIQSVPGFEDFMAAPSFGRVAPVLAPAPGQAGVYLLATTAGGLALIVRAEAGKADFAVTPLWLDGLTES
ncbi:MAG: tetratricopeptide repeat protein, partial [Caldilineaceae bacterium]|nr:tetratricopeptide repeat protein [Caldilineaceae bacterium]